MRIAVVGCGFVADLYVSTLALHSEISIVGVYDSNRERLRQFCAYHQLAAFESLDALLDDKRVQIVVNLTNPRSHLEITKRALEAGRHVYSEKPLAMRYEDALALVELAESKGLQLASAPATVLSETAQTLWKGVRDGLAGRVRLVYAEMDEGLVPRFAFRKWFSKSGKQWPYRDEFEVGCTLEHAGYVLTWLAAMFGPAISVTAFSSVLYPDKLGPDNLGREEPIDSAADFSVACIRFANGVTARMTNSIIAPHDHRFRVFGDEGVLSVRETWHTRAPVYFRKWIQLRRRTMLMPIPRRLPLAGTHLRTPKSGGSQVIDFARGVAELAAAVKMDRPCRLGARFSLHISELALAAQLASENSATYQMRSSFQAIEPMDWAR